MQIVTHLRIGCFMKGHREIYLIKRMIFFLNKILMVFLVLIILHVASLCCVICIFQKLYAKGCWIYMISHGLFIHESTFTEK